MIDERLKVSAPESVVTDSRKWVGGILSAVILGEGIWSLLVSITHNLAVPALARFMGGDPQSPLYLGKGDFNVPALLVAVLEACFAGIVAVVLYSWSQKSGRTRTRVVRVASAAPQKSAPIVFTPTPEASPTGVTPPPAPPAGTTDRATQSSAPATPRPVQSVPQAPPAKPKKPKQVYYNIVGEPIEDDED